MCGTIHICTVHIQLPNISTLPQVCATLNGSNTIPGVLSQKLHPDISAEIYERISELSLPTSEKKVCVRVCTTCSCLYKRECYT